MGAGPAVVQGAREKGCWAREGALGGFERLGGGLLAGPRGGVAVREPVPVDSSASSGRATREAASSLRSLRESARPLLRRRSGEAAEVVGGGGR